jgi:hypothetical protein
MGGANVGQDPVERLAVGRALRRSRCDKRELQSRQDEKTTDFHGAF